MYLAFILPTLSHFYLHPEQRSDLLLERCQGGGFHGEGFLCSRTPLPASSLGPVFGVEKPFITQYHLLSSAPTLRAWHPVWLWNKLAHLVYLYLYITGCAQPKPCLPLPKSLDQVTLHGDHNTIVCVCVCVCVAGGGWVGGHAALTLSFPLKLFFIQVLSLTSSDCISIWLINTNINTPHRTFSPCQHVPPSDSPPPPSFTPTNTSISLPKKSQIFFLLLLFGKTWQWLVSKVTNLHSKWVPGSPTLLLQPSANPPPPPPPPPLCPPRPPHKQA